MYDNNLVRTLVVDDHPVVRRGIAFALGAFDDICVVGEASNGDEAVRLCDMHHPDVVVMDMMMPGMDGSAATRKIREQNPTTQVLVLSSFHEAQLVRDALKAGAIGYLLKDVAIDELAQAVRSASRGQSTLHRAATQALIQAQSPPARVDRRPDRPPASSTGPGRAGAQQPGDRQAAVPRALDRPLSRERHPGQARRSKPRRSCGAGGQARFAGLTPEPGNVVETRPARRLKPLPGGVPGTPVQT